MRETKKRQAGDLLGPFCWQHRFCKNLLQRSYANIQVNIKLISTPEIPWDFDMHCCEHFHNTNKNIPRLPPGCHSIDITVSAMLLCGDCMMNLVADWICRKALAAILFSCIWYPDHSCVASCSRQHTACYSIVSKHNTSYLKGSDNFLVKWNVPRMADTMNNGD